MEKVEEFIERLNAGGVSDAELQLLGSVFRKVSDGLYYCVDQELMEKLSCEIPFGKEFIPYQQLGRDRPIRKC